MGNPFELKARDQDDLVDAGGDGSPSVSSKNEETSTPPGPPESSDRFPVSANLESSSSYPVAPEPVVKCLQLIAGSEVFDTDMLLLYCSPLFGCLRMSNNPSFMWTTRGSSSWVSLTSCFCAIRLS